MSGFNILPEAKASSNSNPSPPLIRSLQVGGTAIAKTGLCPDLLASSDDPRPSISSSNAAGQNGPILDACRVRFCLAENGKRRSQVWIAETTHGGFLLGTKSDFVNARIAVCAFGRSVATISYPSPNGSGRICEHIVADSPHKPFENSSDVLVARLIFPTDYLASIGPLPRKTPRRSFSALECARPGRALEILAYFTSSVERVPLNPSDLRLAMFTQRIREGCYLRLYYLDALYEPDEKAEKVAGRFFPGLHLRIGASEGVVEATSFTPNRIPRSI